MGNLIKKFLCRNFSIVILLFFMQNPIYSQSIVSDGKGVSSIPLNPGFKETKKEDAENKPKIEEVSFNLGLVKFTTAD